jgi:hypothetical protein
MTQPDSQILCILSVYLGTSGYDRGSKGPDAFSSVEIGESIQLAHDSLGVGELFNIEALVPVSWSLEHIREGR